MQAEILHLKGELEKLFKKEIAGRMMAATRAP
jgi:hypothetical protein